MKKTGIKKFIITAAVIVAAVSAAVLFNRVMAYTVMPAIFLPSYSKGEDKTVRSVEGDITAEQEGRRLIVFHDGEKIWELPKEYFVQDAVIADIDHDGGEELLVLCWKRGRFGKHRPSWVKRDEWGYSQHIFVYEIEGNTVRPKWMSSDIGEDAASVTFDDGCLMITEADGDVAKWRWNSWGFEKM